MKYEVQPANADETHWCVVNNHSGRVYAEALELDAARELCDQLNSKVEFELVIRDGTQWTNDYGESVWADDLRSLQEHVEAWRKADSDFADAEFAAREYRGGEHTTTITGVF